MMLSKHMEQTEVQAVQFVLSNRTCLCCKNSSKKKKLCVVNVAVQWSLILYFLVKGYLRVSFMLWTKLNQYSQILCLLLVVLWLSHLLTKFQKWFLIKFQKHYLTWQTLKTLVVTTLLKQKKTKYLFKENAMKSSES